MYILTMPHMVSWHFVPHYGGVALECPCATTFTSSFISRTTVYYSSASVYTSTHASTAAATPISAPRRE